MDELCDGYLVLLKPPLDQLGAADVDRIENMPGVVFHKRPAVNDQCAFGPILQKAGKFLGVHHLAWESVSGHGRLVSLQQREKGKKGQDRRCQLTSPKVEGIGGRGRQLQTAKSCHVAKILCDKPLCQTCWKEKKEEEKEV